MSIPALCPDSPITFGLLRSTVVNIDRIRKIEPGIGTESIVVLEDGQRLMVSRANRRGKVKELLS